MNYNFKDAPKRLFLAELEHSMKTNGVTEEAQQQIRQTVVPNMMRKVTNCNLTHQEKQALRSLKADKDIIILPADKGRLTVVMDKQDYISKARQLLSDTTTYREIDTDPSQKLIKKINKNLKKLQDVNEITKSERWRMRADETTLAQFYGLPKIHKVGTPLRPIVSLPGTPTYNLSKELFKKLNPLIRNSPHSITNAIEFLQKLEGIELGENDIMISFDVTALFTSIDLGLARSVLKELVEHSSQQIGRLQQASLYKLVDLCMKTYFEFDGKIYEQKKAHQWGRQFRDSLRRPLCRNWNL